MKVFIGWSGETSHQVALALRDWLPKVIQTLKPYVSSEDIAKGARWSTTLAAELQASSFGTICVTRENANSPWINFEAGALSKEIEKSLVVPFLFGLKTSDIEGPLAQFQGVVNDEQDIAKLLASINDAQPDQQRLDKSVLNDSFQLRWPKLKERLDEIQQNEVRGPAAPRRQTQELVEELLDTVRSQRLMESDRFNLIFDKQDLLAQNQGDRITALTGVVSALARSVESLHQELPARELTHLENLRRLMLSDRSSLTEQGSLSGQNDVGSTKARYKSALAERISRVRKAQNTIDETKKDGQQKE